MLWYFKTESSAEPKWKKQYWYMRNNTDNSAVELVLTRAPCTPGYGFAERRLFASSSRHGSVCFFTETSALRVVGRWHLERSQPAAGRADPYGCETVRLPHFLGNRLTDGSEVVGFMSRTPITYKMIAGTHFSQKMGWNIDHNATVRM
jgi:hypothetical protein